MSRFTSVLGNGIWKQNPVLVLILGMCAALATSTSAWNGLTMGLATTFVLVCSCCVISAIRFLVPEEIRIVVYFIVICVFASIVDFLMQAYVPIAICQALGIYLPLIVVNCLILVRAEVFASKNTILMSFADGLGMGIGFTLVLTLLGAIREFFGAGTLFDVSMGCWRSGFSLLLYAPGGFILLGLILGLINVCKIRKAAKNGLCCDLPQDADCTHCMIFRLGGNTEGPDFFEKGNIQ